jgi:hypothetical protein
MEIDAAKGQGKSVIAYAAELSSKRGVRVLNAHIKSLQSSSSEGSESSDKSEDDVAEVSDVNFTRIGKYSSNLDAVQFNRDAARAAADSALVFAISSSWEADMSREMENMAQQLSGDDRSFGGIVLDSACTGVPVVSADEYLRYCRDTGAEYSIEPNSSGVVRFGDAKKRSKQGRVRSLGQARIRASIDSFGEVFQFWAHVVPGTDTPMLMSLQDLDGLGYEMRTGTRTLTD